MSARNLLTAGGIFMAANLMAGLLNYFFQIVASQKLNSADFSVMSSWIAHVSVLFIGAGVLQYGSNFLPASARGFRLSLVGLNFGFILLIAIWFLSAPGLTLSKAAIMLIGAILFGWTLGQVQGRLLFLTVAAVNVAVGVSKNLIVLLPLPLSDMEKFAFAFFACNLPAVWVITTVGFRHAEPPKRQSSHSGQQGLTAAVLLSSYAILIPQIDLIILNWTQSRDAFNEIARASVFYKAIYFFFFAIAQFLLPIQLRSTSRSLNPWFGSVKLGGIALLSCGMLALASPWIIRDLLRWDSEPGRDLIFLSCLNMTVFTWIFMLAQEACARRRIQPAALGLAFLGTEWALQWLLAFPTTLYFALALISRLFVLILLYRGLTLHQESRSPSTDPI